MAEQLVSGPMRPLPAEVMGAPASPAEAEAAEAEETDTTAAPQPVPAGQAQPIAAAEAEEGQPSAAEELEEPGAEAEAEEAEEADQPQATAGAEGLTAAAGLEVARAVPAPLLRLAPPADTTEWQAPMIFRWSPCSLKLRPPEALKRLCLQTEVQRLAAMAAAATEEGGPRAV